MLPRSRAYPLQNSTPTVDEDSPKATNSAQLNGVWFSEGSRVLADNIDQSEVVWFQVGYQNDLTKISSMDHISTTRPHSTILKSAFSSTCAVTLFTTALTYPTPL